MDPGSMVADLAIQPWGTEPGSRYTTPDIWIDSPANGFDICETARYPDGAPIGNGDRPLPGERNRIYYRFRNEGSVRALNVSVRVEVAVPVGIGDGDDRFQLVATHMVPTIEANDSFTSYAYWEPPFEHGGHGCIRVTLEHPGDVNHHNNRAQENISAFDSTRNSPFRRHATPLIVENRTASAARVLMDIKGLPEGWAFRLDPMSFVLAKESSRVVQVELFPSGASGANTFAEEGQIIHTEVRALAWHGDVGDGGQPIGGVDFFTHLVFPSMLTLSGVNPEPNGMVLVQGCLSPARSAAVGITASSEGGAQLVRVVSTDAATGCYAETLQLESGTWKVASHVVVSPLHARASSDAQVVVVP